MVHFFPIRSLAPTPHLPHNFCIVLPVSHSQHPLIIKILHRQTVPHHHYFFFLTKNPTLVMGGNDPIILGYSAADELEIV